MNTEGTENNQEEGNNQGLPATENNDNNGSASGENNAAPAVETKVPEQQTAPTVIEPDEESIKKFFASKGRSVEKLDDLFTEKEKIVEVNPYENVSDDLKQILQYQKETGRGIQDYLKLQENIDERPLVELALEKVRKDVGDSFSPEDLTTYLEDALSIDLSGDLTSTEKVKLTKFVKDYKEELKAEQEKYKTPLPKTPEAQTAPKAETITLADGQVVDKVAYEEHEKNRQIYLNDIKEAVNSVAASSIKIEFDNNGTKEELTFAYDYDANDHQGMVAMAEDLDVTVAKLFRTEQGFNHSDFIESTWFLDKVNRGKWAAALVNKARAEAITELTKADNNVNYQTNALPKQELKAGVKIVPVNQLFNS